MALALVGLGACASKPPPPAARPQPARSARVAWLPVEPLVSPELARALNDRMSRLALPGASAPVRAPVSMEVAQLAIECIKAAPDCYAAVGRSVGADRVLWAELSSGQAPSQSIHVALSLFDVGAGAMIARAEQTFPGKKEAEAGIGALVDHAFDPPRAAGKEGTP